MVAVTVGSKVLVEVLVGDVELLPEYDADVDHDMLLDTDTETLTERDGVGGGVRVGVAL